ncbi:MAG TPA: glycosyltransferase family 87 protein [Cyclobacteriaceae bacterium]
MCSIIKIKLSYQKSLVITEFADRFFNKDETKLRASSNIQQGIFQRAYTSKDILLLAFGILCLNILANIVSNLKGAGYPYTIFLIDPRDRFGDFFKVMDGLQIADTWEGVKSDFIYYEHLLPFTAFTYMVFAKLIVLIGNKFIVFAGLCVTIFGGIYFAARRAGNAWWITPLIILSYPMIFAIDRGNIATIVFLLLLLALVSDHLALSTLAIAIATSLKLTPLIFLLPVVLNYPINGKIILKTLLLFFAWFVLVNLIALIMDSAFLTPAVQNPISPFLKTLGNYNTKHILSLEGLGFGSSLYMPTVYLASVYNIVPVLQAYELAILVFSVIFLFLLTRRKLNGILEQLLTKEKVIFILCISFVLLMPVSADYYLLIMFIPLLLYPNSQYSFGYFVTFGLLMGAKNFQYIGIVGYNYISWQVFINPILLLILLFGEFDLISFIKRDSSKLLMQESKWIILAIKANTLFGKFKQATKIKHVVILLSTIIVIGSTWFLIEQNDKGKKQKHNIEAGLPIDFDPKKYLDLNPQIIEYWRSRGIVDTGKTLYVRAEEHYKTFGAKEGYRFK